VREDRDSAGLEITNLITYPAGQVSQELHKNDVIKSISPITWDLKFEENAGKNSNAGYLVFKNPSNSSVGSKRFWI
jgi:hypothetical protein